MTLSHPTITTPDETDGLAEEMFYPFETTAVTGLRYIPVRRNVDDGTDHLETGITAYTYEQAAHAASQQWMDYGREWEHENPLVGIARVSLIIEEVITCE